MARPHSRTQLVERDVDALEARLATDATHRHATTTGRACTPAPRPTPCR